MIETILIIAFSLVLFVYWFRYTVLLLLSEDQVEQSPALNSQLSLLETREALRDTQGDLPLDRLHHALERDYRMLRYLLDHAAGLGLRPVERFLLMLDYRMLRIWYRLSRNASAPQARRALQEMAGILNYIASKMDQRAGSPSEA
jgi:hypothetical protein